jgi:hypothetical protein
MTPELLATQYKLHNLVFGLKSQQRDPFKIFALLAWHLSGGISVHIRGAAESFGILVKRIELGPILAVFEPLVEPAIMHFPFAH